LERWWWQLFWQLRRQCMPVQVMAEIAGMLVGMLSEDMPRPAMLGVDTLVFVLAVHVVLMWRGPRAAMPASQVAHVIGMAAVTGEVVTGEAVTGIRPMDILGSALTVSDTAIHTTGIHITATAIHTTVITLTVTDTGRP
jgi:hypothetical protein